MSTNLRENPALLVSVAIAIAWAGFAHAQDAAPADDGIASVPEAFAQMAAEGTLLEIAVDTKTLPAGGHVQGIQWKHDAEAGRHLAFLSHDSATAGYLLVAEFPEELPGEGRVIHFERFPSDGGAPPLRHAGGMQLVGNVLVVGLEDNQQKTRSEIQFWNVADPSKPAQLKHLTVERSGAPKDKTAGAVGLAELGPGHLLAVANWDSRAIDFYTSNGKPLGDVDCRFAFAARWQDTRADKAGWQPDASFGSYQAVNLVTDMAGKVYLLGFETAFPGDDLVELYAVDLSQPPEKLLGKLASKRIALAGDNHFISGAGIRIDGGRLSILATQRNLAPRTKITLGR
jgi:hypothetical protein